MKIAIIIKNFKPPYDEGTKKIIRVLIEYLESKRDKIIVISDEQIESQRSLHNKFRNIKLLRKMETFFIYRKILKEQKVDVFFAIEQGKTFLGLKCFLWELLFRVPYYIYISSMNNQFKKYNLLLNQERVFIGGTFLKKYFPNACQIFPPIDLNSIDLQYEKNKSRNWSNIHRKKKVILFLGAFQKERGLEILIEAVSQLKDRDDIKLILAWNGRGTLLSRIRSLIKEKKIETITTILGSTDINDLYRQAHILIIPRITGRDMGQKMFFPLRIIEAMAFRKPIIVTNLYDWDKAINGSGIAVKAGSAIELKTAIEKLISDEQFYNSCSEECERLFKEVYHPLKSLSKIYDVLHKNI